MIRLIGITILWGGFDEDNQDTNIDNMRVLGIGVVVNVKTSTCEALFSRSLMFTQRCSHA